jgi:hypothetical protein
MCFFFPFGCVFTTEQWEEYYRQLRAIQEEEKHKRCRVCGEEVEESDLYTILGVEHPLKIFHIACLRNRIEEVNFYFYSCGDKFDE